MQSDGNSFCGDVALDNMACGDEDSILDQQYLKLISWDLKDEDFEF